MRELKVGQPARGSSSGRPIMVLLDGLGRRGALRILWELRDGRQLTFRSLLEASDSNPGALNTRLKELRGLGLVEHHDGGYHLSEYGAEVEVLLHSLNRAAERRDLEEGREGP